MQGTTNWSASSQSLGKLMEVSLPGTHFSVHERRRWSGAVSIDLPRITHGWPKWLIAFYDKNDWISGWGESGGCHLPCLQQGFWPYLHLWNLSSLFLSMVWIQGWPCFEEEIGLETFWAPFQPELSCDPQKDLVPQEDWGLTWAESPFSNDCKESHYSLNLKDPNVVPKIKWDVPRQIEVVWLLLSGAPKNGLEYVMSFSSY